MRELGEYEVVGVGRKKISQFCGQLYVCERGDNYYYPLPQRFFFLIFYYYYYIFFGGVWGVGGEKRQKERKYLTVSWVSQVVHTCARRVIIIILYHSDFFFLGGGGGREEKDIKYLTVSWVSQVVHTCARRVIIITILYHSLHTFRIQVRELEMRGKGEEEGGGAEADRTQVCRSVMLKVFGGMDSFPLFCSCRSGVCACSARV